MENVCWIADTVLFMFKLLASIIAFLFGETLLLVVADMTIEHIKKMCFPEDGKTWANIAVLAMFVWGTFELLEKIFSTIF